MGLVQQDERFGARVRRLREARDLSRQDLAERARLSIYTIIDIEQGKTKSPEADTLASVADALGESMDYVWRGHPKDETPVAATGGGVPPSPIRGGSEPPINPDNPRYVNYPEAA